MQHEGNTMPPSILIVRDSGLGDLITALPALRALRRSYLSARLVMTCPSSLRPLADWMQVADLLLSEDVHPAIDPSMHPASDRFITDSKSWEALTHFDVIVVLRVPDEVELVRSLATLHPSRLITYRVNGLAATANCPEFYFSDHILRRWDRLLRAFGITPDPNDLFLDKFVKTRGATTPLPAVDRGCTIIHVGAGSVARRWPPERWGLLGRTLRQRGHRVLITASRHESELAREACEIGELPADCNLSGSTDILTLVGLVANAKLVLSTDTGVAHIAAAFRRPSITLFGPVSPSQWGPPLSSIANHCIWHGGSGDPYGPVIDPGLLSISVSDVLKLIHSD